MKTLKLVAAFLFTSALTACVTFPTVESEKVMVVWDNPDEVKNCDLIGPVIGSEGHFYDYWLHADRDMLWGTLNQLRIKAAEMGGDKVYLYSPIGFSSSFTQLANVYACGDLAKVKAQKYLAIKATQKIETK